jgi:hypothetical protein
MQFANRQLVHIWVPPPGELCKEKFKPMNISASMGEQANKTASMKMTLVLEMTTL